MPDRETAALDRPEKIPGGTGRFIDCPNCGGDGEIVDCWDDICLARGRCMHGDNKICRECHGDGRVWMWFSDVLEQHPELRDDIEGPDR